MLMQLKKQGRLNETLFLGILCLISFGMAVFRFMYTDTLAFLFLIWNLFLAGIPWALSSLMLLKPEIQQNKLAVLALLIVWLLFFPNAPYILTDLFHLCYRSGAPLWFDLVLILSFAWTGLLFGFLSLWDIEQILKKRVRATWVPAISVGLLFLGSFGIYVGRYLGWNSWDILREPLDLVYDIGSRLTNPFRHPRAWGMTLFMGVFLNMVYGSFRLIRSRRG